MDMPATLLKLPTSSLLTTEACQHSTIVSGASLHCHFILGPLPHIHFSLSSLPGCTLKKLNSQVLHNGLLYTQRSHNLSSCSLFPQELNMLNFYSSLISRPPLILPSVCIHNNTWKTGKKRGAFITWVESGGCEVEVGGKGSNHRNTLDCLFECSTAVLHSRH